MYSVIPSVHITTAIIDIYIIILNICFERIDKHINSSHRHPIGIMYYYWEDERENERWSSSYHQKFIDSIGCLTTLPSAHPVTIIMLIIMGKRWYYKIELCLCFTKFLRIIIRMPHIYCYMHDNDTWYTYIDNYDRLYYAK